MPGDDGAWIQMFNQIQGRGYFSEGISSVELRKNNAETALPQSVCGNQGA